MPRMSLSHSDVSVCQARTRMWQGVVTSVLSLMLGIVGDHMDEYEDSVRRSVDRLRKVCLLTCYRARAALLTCAAHLQILYNEDYLDDYVYYKVPAPWVQVKILRLVQMYPPPGMSPRVCVCVYIYIYLYIETHVPEEVFRYFVL